jgi:hypothetical protein
MKRAKQQSERKLTEEQMASLPILIGTSWRVDRLARVRSWLRMRQGRKPSRFQKLRFINNVAAVIAVTYVERGDDAAIPDDVALTLIRDLLLKLDPEIIERVKNNEKKPLYHSRNSLTVSVK